MPMSMAGYTKLFNSILASTIWRADDKTRIVWITLLAMADKDGVAEGSVPGLADFARVSIPACQRALKALSEPDEWSRSQEHAGRRIEALSDGRGWRLLNHAKYRERMGVDERREYLKLKQREYRKRGPRKQPSTTVNNVSDKSTLSTQAEADTEADTEARERQTRARGPAPLVDQRQHRNHAHCGRVCLHASLFGEFVKRRNHAEADREIRDWALTVEQAWADRSEEPGDAFDFWRARYADKWPQAASAKASKTPAWAREA